MKLVNTHRGGSYLTLFFVAEVFWMAGCGASRGTGSDGINQNDVLIQEVGAEQDVADASVENVGCVDNDGDGRGVGCLAGLDCDDNDPAHWDDCPDCDETHAAACPCLEGESFPCYEGEEGTEGVGICRGGTRYCIDGHLGLCIGQVLPAESEICGNGQDDNCNGIGDEEVFSPCGNCDHSCHTEGQIEPSPSDPGSEGVVENPDGPGIVLGTSEIDAGYAWIANADEGTVSKLRLSDGVEVARYRVGLWGSYDDQPSRTAVDSLGNAYVANRAHHTSNNQPSVTKIAGDEKFCIDRNGNTIIDTSHDSTPLPLGADECVLWTVPVGNPGGCARAMAIDLGEIDDPFSPGNPWVGLWSEMRFFKLSPDDGAVVEEVEVDVNPYGAAIDHNGWIWISGMRPRPGYIQRFHTVSLTVEPPISLEGTGCDSPTDRVYSPYGIAVDMNDRVWVGSWSPNVCRYDPADGSFFTVTLYPDVARGVAVDRDGYIWASNYSAGGEGENHLIGFNIETGEIVYDFLIAGHRPIGVGVDELNQIWTVNQLSATATRLQKSSGVLTETTVGDGPYTYSDFTGYQRSIMMDEGRWYHIFERCDETPDDEWLVLIWDADTPLDSKITIYGYSAPDESRLWDGRGVILANLPPDVPPVDIKDKFESAGVALYRYLGILVVLEPSGDNRSPVFRSVEVQYRCGSLG